MATDAKASATTAATPLFATTHWSVVLSAAGSSSLESQAALERLCRSYWYPLYAYLRRCGHADADAQDLVQSFFVSLIEHDWVATANPDKGRFRSFLLVCLNRFVGGQVQQVNALKRGGGKLFVSLDDQDAAERYALASEETIAPEEAYDRNWASALLEQAWDRLREECQAADKLPLFEQLKAAQTEAAESPTYKQLAAHLNLTESALKSAMLRLRVRYREILRAEVAQTVSDPRDVDDEIRYLLKVVSR